MQSLNMGSSHGNADDLFPFAKLLGFVWRRTVEGVPCTRRRDQEETSACAWMRLCSKIIQIYFSFVFIFFIFGKTIQAKALMPPRVIPLPPPMQPPLPPPPRIQPLLQPPPPPPSADVFEEWELGSQALQSWPTVKKPPH